MIMCNAFACSTPDSGSPLSQAACRRWATDDHP
jgi:hypothetical protein